MDNETSINYNRILRQIIAEIKSTRVSVAKRINASVIQMYWNIGKQLSEEGLEKGYGASVVERLSIDLKNEFPDTTGFSPRNLWDMKRFYEFYCHEDEKLRQAVAVLPWGHNLEFIGITQPIKERELERRLVEKIRLFLLELGNGFTFIGNQYRLVFNQRE